MDFMNLDWLAKPETWIGLLTLTALEIVLGVDNIIFIAIISGKLPPEEQQRGRKLGLILALIPRILFLLMLGWILSLQKPILFGRTGQDLVLLVGGLFLIAKSVHEIHEKLESGAEHVTTNAKSNFKAVIIQIIGINFVFSIDSVVTAVGMVKQVEVMVLAVVISTFFMIGFAGPVGHFVEKHPTVKMLALSFLLLIGGNLIMEGCGVHVPKGYAYFAMGFAVFVEVLNLKIARRAKHPVHLLDTPDVDEADLEEKKNV